MYQHFCKVKSPHIRKLKKTILLWNSILHWKTYVTKCFRQFERSSSMVSEHWLPSPTFDETVKAAISSYAIPFGKLFQDYQIQNHIEDRITNSSLAEFSYICLASYRNISRALYHQWNIFMPIKLDTRIYFLNFLKSENFCFQHPSSNMFLAIYTQI